LDFGWTDCIFAGQPPSTVANAMIVPGTVQWKAREGAYIIPTLYSSDVVAGTDNTNVVLSDGSSIATLRPIGNYNAFPIPTGTATYSLNLLTPTGLALTDFNYSGVYFTGLSNPTTLTVNLIRYFERFPNFEIATDKQLTVLATPSCRNDPQAIELYSAVIRHMPVGVPQRFNGIGDWFREAAQTARDVIAPVLSAIPLPLAQFGANVLNGVGNNLVKKYSNEEKKMEISPGQIYNAQGNQSNSSSMKKPTVSAKMAAMGLSKKKKKKVLVTTKLVKK